MLAVTHASWGSPRGDGTLRRPFRCRLTNDLLENRLVEGNGTVTHNAIDGTIVGRAQVDMEGEPWDMLFLCYNTGFLGNGIRGIGVRIG